MPSYDCGFLWNKPLPVHVQPTKLSDIKALPTFWLGGSMRGLQPGGHVHKEAVHLLSLQYRRHPLQAQAPFNPSVMACHSLERTHVFF